MLNILLEKTIKVKDIIMVIIAIIVIYLIIMYSRNIYDVLKWWENNNFFSNLVSFISLIVASFIWYVWYKFNKSSLYRTEMAFEEFRPHLIFKLAEKNSIIIENIWQFEASDIKLYYGRYWENTFKQVNWLNWVLISPWLNKDFDYNWKAWYYSFIIFYTNLASWKYYISWVNYIFATSLKNIWEDYSNNDLNINYKSPFILGNFTNIVTQIKIENQIKKNINVNKIINDFEKTYL